MLKFGTTFNNTAAVKECISNLTTLVQRYRDTSTVTVPLFLATDFADHAWDFVLSCASCPKKRQVTHEDFNSSKTNYFQPLTYNLTDRGSLVIVELNILVSSKRLFVVGGGSFQTWLASKFLNDSSTGHRYRARCQNELCNN